MSQNLLWCSIVEAEYRALTNTLDLLINVPHLALRVLKGHIKRFEAVVLAGVEGRLDVLVALLDEMWNLIMNSTGFDRFDKKNICGLAFSCRALRDHLFPADGNDPTYVQGIPQDVRDTLRDFDSGLGLDQFDKYVCKLSFKSLLNGFVDETLKYIQVQLDELLELLGINKIDEWIDDYITASLPFLRALQGLDVFAECAFEGCNFVQTALNKQEDVEERLLLQRQGSGWSVKADDLIASARRKDNELRQRIDELRTRLANPKFGSQGVQASDLLKF